jgi:hypothetical protein
MQPPTGKRYYISGNVLKLVPDFRDVTIKSRTATADFPSNHFSSW